MPPWHRIRRAHPGASGNGRRTEPANSRVARLVRWIVQALEHYGARRDVPGWDAPDYDDARWQPVASSGGPTLVAQPNEPIRITRRLTQVAVTEPQPGVFISDMGQNMVGWARMRLRGQPGDDIRFRYGEALNSDGALYRDNLRLPDPNDPHRGAQQEDHYICRGDGDETFEPHFTYHGFRYVEVTGLRYTPQADDLAGCVFHSSGADVGQFEGISQSSMPNRQSSIPNRQFPSWYDSPLFNQLLG